MLVWSKYPHRSAKSPSTKEELSVLSTDARTVNFPLDSSLIKVMFMDFNVMWIHYSMIHRSSYLWKNWKSVSQRYPLNFSIHFWKEGKRATIAIQEEIHRFLLSFSSYSTSDSEFDKRQEDFDKMIERQPLTVRETDFEYQVDECFQSINVFVFLSELVPSFGSLRTSASVVSLSEATLVFRSSQRHSTVVSSLCLGRSARLFGSSDERTIPQYPNILFHR